MSDRKTVPDHVALILDGNRRWARQKGLPVLAGHRQGAMAVEKILKKLRDSGVHTTTIWIFSTENWDREPDQVAGLMGLFEEFLNTYTDKAHKEKTRIIHIGRKDRISEKLAAKIKNLEEATSHLTDHILNIGLDYGGRDDIMRATRKMIQVGVEAENVTEDLFQQYLDTADQPHPYPDLIIRTGGEQRMSGFMLWQAAYAEYEFEPKYLPDLTPDDVTRILEKFATRDRRYGT